MFEADKTFQPSRQYVYWKERMQEDGQDPSKITDSGANVQDGVRYVAANGVCSEASWPYDTKTVDVAPPASCDVEAAAHKLGSLNNIAVGDLDTIKRSLLLGVPVMIAIGVYKSFNWALTGKFGIIKMPNPVNVGDKNDPVDPFSGGHEMLIVGYHDFPGYFTVLNSWGTGWGNHGYGYLPYGYVSNTKFTYELCSLSN
jgi:C1A family cysteine protease